MQKRSHESDLALRRAGRVAVMFLALGLLTVAGCRPEERPDPAQRIAEGWSWFRSGDFGPAVKSFESALASAPGAHPLRQEALYGLACTWNLRRPDENPELALAYYREVIALDPQGDLAAWSALASARMRTLPVAGEDVPLQDRINAYQEVIDQYPGHAAGEEAFLFQQAAWLGDPKAGQEQAVLEALEAHLRARPDTRWSSAIHQLIAHCGEALDLPDRRLAALIGEWKAREAVDAVADRALVYWRLATVAEFEAGDFDVAREYYGRLISEFPTEQRVFLARQELERMDAVEAGLMAQGTEPRGQTP